MAKDRLDLDGSDVPPSVPLGVPFEQSLSELEAVVKQLESSDLPLEKALELFARGMRLSETCRKKLTDAETRVEMLMKKGDVVEAVPFKTDDDVPF